MLFLFNNGGNWSLVMLMICVENGGKDGIDFGLFVFEVCVLLGRFYSFFL